MAGEERQWFALFKELLVMRLEQDYDSIVAASLVVGLIASAAFNPFLSLFDSFYSSPVIVPLLPIHTNSVLQPPPILSSVTGINVAFDSFLISVGFALALIFRNISFGAVAEIQNGTMACFVSMPGGRKAAFVSVIISGAVLPYLLSALSIAVAIYASGAKAALPDYLLAIGANFLPVMGLASVTLGSGSITGKCITSFSLGVIYVLLIVLGVAVTLLGRSIASVQLMGIFIPSYAVLSALQLYAGSLLLAELFISGIVFNSAVLYLTYYFWVRFADFRPVAG